MKFSKKKLVSVFAIVAIIASTFVQALPAFAEDTAASVTTNAANASSTLTLQGERWTYVNTLDTKS